ncbi:hypothetical protein ACWGB8_08915 [Kitasatospora sp. NPDC054939]
MLWVLLAGLGAYLLGAALTTRLVFHRGRARFLDATSAEQGPRGALADFERRERPQVEAIALLTGAGWVVAAPALALKRAVASLLLARPSGGVPGPAQDVAERIDELERALRIGAHAEPHDGRAAIPPAAGAAPGTPALPREQSAGTGPASSGAERQRPV